MNQKTKMRYTSQKGITLIALVITIIVLLILAGVTISMMLGEDGIISQAQDAKKQNEESSLKDAISVAKADAATFKYVKQIPMEEDELEEKGFTFPADYEYKESVARVVAGVPIPIGFAYVEGTKVDTGLIVVDGYGNEYVWVPVDEVLASGTANYTDNKVSLINNANDAVLMNGDTDKGLNATEFADDYEDMKKSVSLYGGFYVGRYETSWTGSRVASVANVETMTGDMDLGPTWEDIYTWTTDKNEATWYGLYAKQKELYNKESDSVVSGMIYGSQWDAIMDWMSDIENPNAVYPEYNTKYIYDSTKMGNYGGTPIKTGSNLAYSVKNIFDLAGNYFEWTQEKEDDVYRFYRGGDYAMDILDEMHYPASFKSIFGTPNFADGGASRLQLYIK